MSAIRIVMGSLRDARVRLLAVLGVAGLAAGAGVLTAGAALAGVGSQPGSLELLNAAGGSVITSGSLSSTPSWQTTSACPSGFQSSASISEFYNNGTSSTIITSAVNAGLSSSTGFGPSGALGTFEDTVGGSLSFAGISGSSPGTAEWVVGCYGPSGGTDVEWTQSVFVSVAAGATTYTTSSSTTSPTGTPTSTPTSSPTPTISPTPTPTSTPTPTPTSTHKPKPKPKKKKPKPKKKTPKKHKPKPKASSSAFPSGAPQTGAGGASLPGQGNDVLIALGIALLAGSAVAAGLAVRRARSLPGGGQPGDSPHIG
jgi:hypothetical protein